MSPSTAPPVANTSAAFAVSDQQRKFFHTFGFIRFESLFAGDVAEITAAFDEVVAGTDTSERATIEPGRVDQYQRAFEENATMESYDRVHFGRRRVIVPSVIDQHERLSAIVADARFVAAAEGLLGPGYELTGSDGNVFYCSTAWHFDSFLASMDQLYVKFFLYLDPVGADSGALRVIPGSHAVSSDFANVLRLGTADWDSIESQFGVSGTDIPNCVVPSRPGDLIATYYRIQHATFGTDDPRRLIAINAHAAPTSP